MWHGYAMRWENLISDLSSQYEQELRREQRQLVGELTRAEQANIELQAKLRGHLGASLQLTCPSAGKFSGVLLDLGADWLLLRGANQMQHTLVRLEAVSVLRGIGPKTATQTTAFAQNLPFNTVLRGIAQDRTWAQVYTSSEQLRARIETVGNNWCEVTAFESQQRVLLSTNHIQVVASLPPQGI